MSDQAQLIAAIVALWATLSAFAGGALKFLVDDVRRKDASLDKTTDALAKNTDTLAEMTRAMKVMADEQDKGDLRLATVDGRLLAIETAARRLADIERETKRLAGAVERLAKARGGA